MKITKVKTVVATLTLSLASIAAAQSADSTQRSKPLAAVTVTATRSERSTFDTPQPITVLDSVVLRDPAGRGAAMTP